MSLEEKQLYLKQEIIDQSYDGNEFSNFISGIRGEENVDLESWSFNDLKSVVAKFKSLYQPKQNNQQEEQHEEESQPEQNEQNENNQEQPPQENTQENEQEKKEEQKIEQKIEQKPSIENEIPNDFLDPLYLVKKTEKLELNEISDNNNLFITISNPVRIKQSLLQLPYYQYDMKTDPVDFKVVRKLSDFTFLYEVLPLFNGGAFNPVLPHFEFGLKDDSPKKMLYIQNYLNSLIENKFFRSLPIVYEFLTVDQEKWNKLKQDNYTKIKPLSLSKMPTLEGKIHININKLEDSKGQKIKDEIYKKQEAFDGLNNAMDEILITLEKLSLCFKSSAKYFLDLRNCHKDNETLSGLFNRLLSLTKIWARDCIKQRDFLKYEVKYYFKFMDKEIVSYLKKYEEFKSSRDDYKSKYDKIKKSPNRLPKDLELVQKLRVNYGLQLAVINSEYQKLLERQANRCINQFVKYSDKKDIILQNFNNCIKLFNINENIQTGEQLQEQISDELEVQNQESGSIKEGNNVE